MPDRGGQGGRARSGPARDFTSVGQIAEPPFARLPDPSTLFATRSSCLAALAEGHALAPYLLFLSRLTAVQDAAHRALPPYDAALSAERVPYDAGPPLSGALIREGDDFLATLRWFVEHAASIEAPEAAERALARLAAMPGEARLDLAMAVREAAYPTAQLGECLYVAAALQVFLTRLAALLDAGRLHGAGDGVCPACGSAPVASAIVGWAGAERSRYCCCSLCQTMWNYVRIKCTACGSTEGISLFQVEGQSPNVAVEACSTCSTYIKHLQQNKARVLDPVADDIASFGLDLLVRDKGYRRATPNPLMVTV